MITLLVLINAVIAGNRFFTNEQISATNKKGISEIVTLYREQGFLRVDVKTYGDTININEGPQFKFGKIKFNGNRVFKKRELRSILKMKRGIIFNQEIFLNDIEKIIKKYENSGYPFCIIKPGNFEFNEDTVNFELLITEGQISKINEIIVTGNNSTKDYVIIRNSGLRKGELFNQLNVNKAQGRLTNFEFIDSAKIEPLNEDTVVITIKEKRANTAEGVIGYRESASGGELAGLFEFRSPNLFGTGRVTHIGWNQLGKLSSNIEIEHKEPWLFNSKFGLNGSFLYRKEDTTYKKKQAELLFNIPITFSLTFNLGAGGEWINQWSQYSGITGIEFNTRTTPGVNYRTKTAISDKGIERIMTNFDTYFGIGKKNILFNSTNFYKLVNTDIPEYDRFKLGGAKTLRGYWEDEFSGTTIGWSNIELRVYNGNSFVFPFYDCGYISDFQNGNEEWKQGFGAGVALESPIGMIKVVYALTKISEFMDGKLHLSLQAVF